MKTNHKLKNYQQQHWIEIKIKNRKILIDFNNNYISNQFVKKYFLS